MNFADFNYYKNEFKGVNTTESFERNIKMATNIVENNINCELENYYNQATPKAQIKIKDTICALVDLIIKREKSDKDISSISIDGVSKSFKSMNNSEFSEKKKECLSFLPDEIVRFV